MAVDTPSAPYEDRSPDWQVCRHVAAGERRVKDEGETYLPRPEGMEEGKSYDDYLARATFFNGYGRALSALHGMVFRKAPEYEVPPALELIIESATQSAKSLERVARWTLREQLETGRVGLLIDAPPLPQNRAGNLTVADARRLNLRPVIAPYRAEDILELRYEAVDNRRMLTRVRLREMMDVSVEDDEFATRPVERWRVLELVSGVYRQRVFAREETDFDRKGGSKEPVEVSQHIPRRRGGAPLDYIPFVVIDADGEPDDGSIAEPPLLDLARHTISLYRTLADLEHGAWFLGFPQRVVIGVDADEGKKFKVGSPTAWVIPNPEAKVEVIGEEGRGLDVLEKRAQAKKQEMSLLGGRMLETDKRQVEAAATALIHRQGEMSILQALALNVSEGVTRALEIARDWQGEQGDVRYHLNQDYVPSSMTPQMVKALLEALLAGKLTFEAWWTALQEGEIIKVQVSAEEALREIEEQAMPQLGFGAEDDDRGEDTDDQVQPEEAA